MRASSATGTETKELLLSAGERLFARDGIHGARIREINELAGQRNPSALHYHFGSREGLVEAILVRYQSAVDVEVERRLDELEARGGEPEVREVIGAVVRPLVATLATQSGRDCVRIVPQFLSALSDNIRRGVVKPITPQTRRVLAFLDRRMAHLPETVRRERLVSYGVVLTSVLAERAHHLEAGQPVSLDNEDFASYLVDLLEAVVTARSTLA